MRKIKITFREVLISTLGSLGAMLIVWLLGILISVVIAKIDPAGKLFTEQRFNWSWETFKTLLCTPIPMWSILTFLSVVVLIFVLYRTFRNPPFLKEREMIVGGLRRRWEWEYDKESKRYVVHSLNTYCPECGAVLTAANGYTCISGHHFTHDQIGYITVLDAIVDSLQKQYPKYRDLIGRYHTLYG